MKKCRVCGAQLFNKPLLSYRNMPKSSQYFPDNHNLNKDKGSNLDVYRCSGCGLVQLANKPVSYYKEDIRASVFSPEMKSFRLKQFKNFISKYRIKGKKIVELGCGKGEYLSLMKACGMKTYGIEYSGPAVTFCKKNGLNVTRAFPEDSKQKLFGAPYEAFYILNFLEHLPSPVTVLKCAVNNLSNKGVGLVEVPNFDMIQKKELFSEFISDHLFYFTKETLTTVLELSGFEVLSCKAVWHDYILSAEVRKRGTLCLEGFELKKQKLKKEFNNFISKTPGSRIAIWGAGHQALAFIALTDIKKEICYVVDSAPFKQGKFTPSSHIKIVSPLELESSPVDAVIVMAASYSDEVAGILRKKYGKKLKIAILRDFGLEVR